MEEYCVIKYLDDVLVHTQSMLARRGKHFCSLYWLVSEYTLIFSSLKFISLSTFLFLGFVRKQWICLYLSCLTEFLRYSSWFSLCY